MEDFEALLRDDPPVDDDAFERERLKRRDEWYASQEGQRAIRKAVAGNMLVQEREFHMPVNQNFLTRVLGFGDTATVQKRLRKVKPVGYGSGGSRRPLYDFREALEHILKPKMDLATYIKTLNPGDLPNQINKAFWEAERTKNKTLIETGEAWPTSSVLQVLGQVFMMIKDRIPLITENMRDLGLTDSQSKELMAMCDQFREDLHKALIDLPKQQSTLSRVVEVDEGFVEFDDGEDGDE